jgi:hypothetical protein
MQANTRGSTLRLNSVTNDDLTALNGYKLNLHVPIFRRFVHLPACNIILNGLLYSHSKGKIEVLVKIQIVEGRTTIIETAVTLKLFESRFRFFLLGPRTSSTNSNYGNGPSAAIRNLVGKREMTANCNPHDFATTTPPLID